jgi:cell division septal protein FtsQ
MSRARAVLTRLLRIGAWTALGLAAAAGLYLLPRALRAFEGTKVRRVEVSGVHYLSPQDALAASGIGSGSSLFDDARVWRAALQAHPLVAEARIRRRLPGTVFIAITETRPLALVRTPTLRVVDVHGRLLPIDPARRDLDLPVLRLPAALDEDGAVTDTVVPRVLAELVRLEAALPALARHVSELQPLPDGGLRLLLRHNAADALLPPRPDDEQLRRLGMILRDLSARAELERVRRIDARYQEQVVVAFHPRKGS